MLEDGREAKGLKGFWVGLTAAGPASWAGAVAFCFFEFVFCCTLFQPRRLARLDPAFVMETRADDYCALSFKLFRLRHSRGSMIQVAYLGASQAIRALSIHDPVKLSKQLTRAVGAPARFNYLTANNQRYDDSLAVTDQLPPTFRGAVVLGVNDYKDDYKVKNEARLRILENRLALESAPSLTEVNQGRQTAESHTGIFFIDHLGFFAARRIAAIRFGPAAKKVATPGRQGEKERGAKRVAELEEHFESGVPLNDGPLRTAILTTNRPIIQRIIDNMNRRGIVVVFLENPEAPIRNGKFGHRIEKFKIDFAEYAEQNGAIFWDFNPEMNLEQSDFQDDVHLGSPRKRVEFQKLLMSHLGELLNERFVRADEHADN